MKTLQELWDSHTGRLMDKWAHYLPIYERYFERFRGKSPRILEIGVSHGGSLQLWKAYFGPRATIWGLDVDPRCANYEKAGIYITIGRQEDPVVHAWYREAELKFDIILDDGSHRLEHQQASLDGLWSQLNDGGVYLIEDCRETYPALPVGCWSVGSYAGLIVFEKGPLHIERIVTGEPSRPLNADEARIYGSINPRYSQTTHPRSELCPNQLKANP
jgi:hypothetical protein